MIDKPCVQLFFCCSGGGGRYATSVRVVMRAHAACTNWTTASLLFVDRIYFVAIATRAIEWWWMCKSNHISIVLLLLLVDSWHAPRAWAVYGSAKTLYVHHDVNNIAANHAARLTDVTKSAPAWLQVLTSTDGRDDKHSLRREYLLPSLPLSITSLASLWKTNAFFADKNCYETEYILETVSKNFINNWELLRQYISAKA